MRLCHTIGIFLTGKRNGSGETGRLRSRCIPYPLAYFSATGNTEQIAKTIADLPEADLYEIVPAQPYSEADLNYSDSSCRANLEQNDATVRPEIEGVVEQMENYDMVLIGHPIWWGEEPRIIDTFMDSYDWTDKTMVNFCTSGGSGITAASNHLKAMSENAFWLEGHRFETGASIENVQAWLNELNQQKTGGRS